MMFNTVDQDLSVYGESWKADHDDAMTVFELEYSVVKGIQLFEAINDIDELIRLKFSDDPRFETLLKMVDSMLSRWIDSTVALLRGSEQYILKGYEIERVNELSSLLIEAKAIVGDQTQFFRSGVMDDLAEKAIKDHHSGRTEAL